MKNHTSTLFRLAIVGLTAFPAYAMAVGPTTGSAYYTDVTNSYVQDQTSQVMGSLNNILCYMGAMGPSLMVNAGDYIALVDQNVCESKGSGGQSGNTGSAYTAVVVNSARASTAVPMTVKAWVSPQVGADIRVYATATQAPDATLPYGVFNMNYCNMTGSVCDTTDRGFINAASNGVLTFYSTNNRGSDSETTQLQLTASSTSTGSGVINEVATRNYNGTPINLDFKFSFAYDANYFVRTTNATVAGTPATQDTQCFDRRPAQAEESVWRYGLYDSNGAQVNRKSGFPIEYTPVGSSVTSNGYIGYYGLWMPITVPSGSTVNKINYSNSAATKVPYTLYSTGGKLYKYTTVPKKLSQLNKVTFWYYAQNTITVSNIPGTVNSIGSMVGGTQNSQYELYWDETAQYFVVSGKINATSHNMEPLAVPGFVTNANMVTGNNYGLFGWSQMLGGQFSINGTEFAKIGNLVTNPSTGINVVTQTQDLVYPSNFAAVGSLTCINDCPTSGQITTSNNAATAATPSYVTPYVNPGWTAVLAANLVTYPLNGATGNMQDPAPATTDVLNIATSGMNANGIRSGRLVDTAGLAAINVAKCGSTVSCPSSSYNQGDVDVAGGIYYVWETGVQPWNQTTYLMSQATTPVLEVFDAPLQVSFVVPTGAKYGSYQGATISLQYGGFGDLWGIPNKCIDVSTNAACNFAQVALYQALNFRWTPDFSIPCTTTAGGACDGTAGLVTVATTQGTVATGTQYYAKALDKEVRLRNATLDAPNPCTTAGLSAPTVSTLSLASSFADPSINVGAKPVVTTAPRVIHGVKQY